MVYFCRIPVVVENRRSSQGGGGVHTPCTLPLDPPLYVTVVKTFHELEYRHLLYPRFGKYREEEE